MQGHEQRANVILYGKRVCGIDEAGRGPIAGPVCAAACMLPADYDRIPLKDSKKLSPRRRLEIAQGLFAGDAVLGIGWAWPEEIDRLNIHHASLLAMRRAFDDLRIEPLEVLVDGKFVPEIPVHAEAIVGGDDRVAEISAASIIAKVSRDLWMWRYARIEPAWEFDRHKGYPTKLHLEKCAEFGLSSIHRRSFRIKTCAPERSPSVPSCNQQPSGTL